MTVYATNQITDRAQAYTLLSEAVQREWGLSTLPEMIWRADGKPSFSDYPQYQFNLSHSQPHALCALDSKPVGADIQIVKDNWREELPGRVCSPEELAWLDAQERRWESFALLWALKESRVKYTGTGLRVGIRKISVPLPQTGTTLYHHEGLWFRIYRGNGWMGAVCGENPPSEELIWL